MMNLPTLRLFPAGGRSGLWLVGLLLATAAHGQRIVTSPDGESCRVTPDCKEHKYDFRPDPGQTFLHWQVRGDMRLLTPEDQNPALACSVGYGKGRLTAHYYTLRTEGRCVSKECPDTVYHTLDYDLFKRFDPPQPIHGPLCVTPGQEVTYWVPPILTDWPHRSAGIGTDSYFWSGFPAGSVVNVSGDSSALTLVLPAGFDAFKLVCQVGRCNKPIATEVRPAPAVPLISSTVNCLPTSSSGSGASFPLTISAEAGTTYTWAKPAGWSLAPAAALTGLTPTTSGPLTVTVTPDHHTGEVSLTAAGTGGCAPVAAVPFRLERQLSAYNALTVTPAHTCLNPAPPVPYVFTVTNPPANNTAYVWTLPDAGWVPDAAATPTGVANQYQTSAASLAVVSLGSNGSVQVRTAACAGSGIARPYTVSGANGCTPTLVSLGCGTYRVLGANCTTAGNSYTWSVTGATAGNQGPFTGSNITFSFPGGFTGGTVTVAITNTGACTSTGVSLPAQSFVPGPPDCRPAPAPTTPGGPIKGDDSPAQLRAFPNPTGAVLNVELPAEAKGTAVKLTIVDATGRVRLASTTDKGAATLDVRALPEGVYSLKAQLPNGEVLTQTVQVHH